MTKTTKNPVDKVAPKKGLTRREFTKSTAAVAAGTSLGLFGGVAPAFAQQREVHHLAWNNFIPPADELTLEFAATFEKESGVKIRFETIGQNDIQARASASIEGGAGPDIIQLFWNHAHLYAGGLADHSAIYEMDGGDKVYAYLQEATTVDGVPRGIPYYGIGNLMAYRTDVYKDLGIEIPDNWDEFLAAGTKCKAEGWPFGQTLGHTLGDAPNFTYSLMWSFGGSEVDESGKVAVNSEATRAAIDWMKEAWAAAFEEGGLSWDDGSNNRAFLAEQICTTSNAASIYFVARQKEMNHVADNMGHYLYPQGPGGPVLRFGAAGLQHPEVLEEPGSGDGVDPVPAPPRQLRALHLGPELLRPSAGPGPGGPADVDRGSGRLDLRGRPGKYSRSYGWPGPFGRGAAEAQSKYIIVDMFARAVQGASAQEAATWAEKELKNVYGA